MPGIRSVSLLNKNPESRVLKTCGLFLLVLFTGTFPFLHGVAQIPVSGVVILSGTGKSLKGAHIVIAGNKAGTSTDSAGRFTLPVPRKGIYTLKVTYVGCKPVEQQVSVDRSPFPPLRIILSENPTMMDEVSVVDKKKETRMLETPARMEIISPEMINANPGQQVTNVLDYISGVNLTGTTGIFGSDQVVSMRGMSGNDQGRTLILLDGVPMNKADGGSVNWNRINRDNLGEILVIKGPGPAKYGSSAMGGVIEMTSRKPEKLLSGTLSASCGTFETFKAIYTLGGIVHPSGGKNGIYYNLNGFYTRSAGYNPEIPEYLEPGDTFYTNTHFREALLGGRVGYYFGKGQQIEAGAEFYNDKRGRGMQIYETEGAYEQHKNYMIRFRYKGVKRQSGWDISGYYNREGFNRMNEFMSDAAYNLYLVESARVDMGMIAGFRWNAGKYHTLSGGAEFKRGTVYGQDIYYTSTDLITNAGQIELYAGYVQDEMNLASGKIRLNLGLRYNLAVFHDGLFRIEYPSYSVEYLKDFQDTLIPRNSWTGFDPKISVQYMFTPSSRVYLSFAKGFRAPNLDDLCRSGKRTDGFRISNPSLGPENLYNLETGADAVIFKKLRVSGSLYYSIGYDFIYAVATGDSVNMGYKISPITQKRNISEVHIYGGEADADLSILRNMNLSAGYTLSVSRIVRYEMPAGDTADNLTGKSLVDVPVNKLTAGFTWTNRILSVNLLYKVVGSRWINDQNEPDAVLGISKFPAYSTFGFRTWHTFFNKLTLALDCDNLFDTRYIDSHYQESPGRMIMLELTFTF
jgi:iron complex outermembrane recepter protein